MSQTWTPKSDRPAPTYMVGVWGWMRSHLFATRRDTLLSLIAALLIYALVDAVISWAFLDASFTGTDREACLKQVQGACWPFIDAKFGQFIYGRYPDAEIWRVDLVFLAGFVGLVPLLMPNVGFKRANVVFLLGLYPVFAFFMLTGGSFGLAPVETADWGGLLVTLVVAVTGIVASLPLGILLALGRRSEMTIVRTLCIGFIEIFRGVPLITVLFMASVMLPLFLPDGVNFDKLMRCLIGVALFSSAYMAEVIRGGLQAIPKGQYEAAAALGLGYWRTTGLVVLPQALKMVIPGIVNTFIGLFKDTTLVLIVGLFDLLGIVQFHFTDASWATPETHITGYVFAAFVFWVFCFAMSRYSIFMENRLSTDRD
ncbi:amino acid ABC transporter permease [Alphaproteobacteria bacterium]|nr:amino acid ABC transporter permease [Alphaproteobacteria bacterium]